MKIDLTGVSPQIVAIAIFMTAPIVIVAMHNLAELRVAELNQSLLIDIHVDLQQIVEQLERTE